MMVLAQVAVEYGVVASRSASAASRSSSSGDVLDRITSAVPTEYIAVGLGILVVLYLGKKVLEAF